MLYAHGRTEWQQANDTLVLLPQKSFNLMGPLKGFLDPYMFLEHTEIKGSEQCHKVNS